MQTLEEFENVLGRGTSGLTAEPATLIKIKMKQINSRRIQTLDSSSAFILGR